MPKTKFDIETHKIHDDRLDWLISRMRGDVSATVRMRMDEAAWKVASVTREAIARGLDAAAQEAMAPPANFSAAGWLREAAAKVRAGAFEDKPADTTTQDASLTSQASSYTRAKGATWHTGLTDAQITEAIRTHTAPGSDVPRGFVEVPAGYLRRTAVAKSTVDHLEGQVARLWPRIVEHDDEHGALESSVSGLQNRISNLELALTGGLAEVRRRLATLESSTQPRTLDATTGVAKKV